MKLFTYGTLRVGESNASILDQSGAYKGTVKTVDTYIMATELSHCFPYVISRQHWPEMSHLAVHITGDIYDVNPSGLAQCDKLEGHPRWYVRTPIDVVDTNGNVYMVEAYILSKHSVEVLVNEDITILNGDWKTNINRIH